MTAVEEGISSELSLKFDQMILDTLMYADVDLTKEAVRLLMVHKSQRDLFFEISDSIQIVYSPKVARMCDTLSGMISELQRLAEMFEIWSDLETDADLEKANRVQEILATTFQYVGRKNDGDKTLGMRSLILADEEVQNILRNLDAMAVFITLQEALYDGGREELKPMIREILKSCNSLICLFVKNSEVNQGVAFQYIEWFVERIDDDIGSSKVLRAILEGNKDLIKKCPRAYLGEFARRIIADGRKPEYLDLFVGMTENSGLYGSRVLSIESEICGYLTAREWKKYILLWCGAKDSQEYYERRLEMERCTEAATKNGHEVVLDEDLTPSLQYHIRILILLANCNLGPRLHAVYPIQDIIAGILDRNTIFQVRRELAHLLICMLQLSIDRAERSEAFWDLLDIIIHNFDALPGDIVALSKNTHTNMRIQRGEWVELCAGILSTFFERFEVDSFTTDLKMDHRSGRPSVVDPRITMQKLYKSIRNLVEFHAGKLGHALTEELNFASAMINRQLDQDSQHGDEADIDTVGTKLQVLRMQHQRNSVVFADVQQTLYRKQFATFLSLLKQQSKDSKEDIIGFFRSIPRIADPVESDVRFEPLVKKLTSHFRSLINKANRTLDPDSFETCSWIIKSFRYMVEAELHFSCDNVYEVDDYDGVIAESTELNNLRRIFNENGVLNLCMDLIAVGIDHAIYIEAIKLLIALLFNGGGILPLQQTIYRYLVGTDSFLFFELIKEMIDNLKAYTIKENDVLHDRPPAEKSAIQKIPEDLIVLYLLQGFCEGSFVPIRDQLREQRGNSKLVNIFELLASYVGLLSKTESICNAFLARTVLKTILRLVQGPCRGNQDQFVLHTELLISLNRIIRDTRPSLYQKTQTSDLLQYQERLKESVIDVIRAIIEGHYETSLVFDRVSTTIDINVLHLLVFPQVENASLVFGLSKEGTVATSTATAIANKAENPSDDSIISASTLTSAQAKYLVLIKHMSKTIDAFQGTEQIEDLKDEITSVEVVFEQQVHIVYFHIPDFIKDISMESKNRVIEDVKNNTTGSRELKLADFVKHCRKLYRESTHQQFLKNYGLAQLWSVKYYLTRFMFLNAMILNILCLLYYGTESLGVDYYAVQPPNHHDDDGHTVQTITDDHNKTATAHMFRRFLLGTTSSASYPPDRLYISPIAQDVVLGLSALQAICALATVVIYAIVRIPVKYVSEVELTGNKWRSGFFAVLDPLVMWYSAYLMMTILALEVNPLFVTVFLLDYVILDSTPQDLLLAVIHPFKQLLATLAMILITLNIFAFSMFVLYRHDVVTIAIHNMWEALKLCISYGFRGEYGIDHEMSPTIGTRMFQDVTFYFLVLSILRHIFFAIIVDTFGKLREMKFERESEAKNSCFICGIERHDYDRMLPPGLDFSFNDHRNLSHNPLHYLYFIMSIWHQPKAKDTSLEIHVRRCLMNGDVHWFPTGVLQELPVLEGEGKRLEGGEYEEGLHEKERGKGGHGGGGHGHEGGGGGGGHGHGGGHHGGGRGGSPNGGTVSPHHGEKGGSMKLGGRQNSMMIRKSLIFSTGESTSNMNSGMNEIMEKMTTMQKHILKLSKDIYQQQGAVRDRVNSSGVLNESMTSAAAGGGLDTSMVSANGAGGGAGGVIPPAPSYTSSPGSLNQLRRTAIVTADQRAPFQPALNRMNSDEMSSDDTYSSTESSEEDEEEEGVKKGASGDKGSKSDEEEEGGGGGGGGEEESGSQKPLRKSMLQLPMISPGSLMNESRKSMKRQGTDRSSFTPTNRHSGLETHRRKHRSSEVEKQLTEKVAVMGDALQMIMKKLEMMETRLMGQPGQTAVKSPVLNSPHVSSGDNSANNPVGRGAGAGGGDRAITTHTETEDDGEGSDRSELSAEILAKAKRRKARKEKDQLLRAQSAQVSTSLDRANLSQTLNENSLTGRRTIVQRPMTAHPYGPAMVFVAAGGVPTNAQNSKTLSPIPHDLSAMLSPIPNLYQQQQQQKKKEKSSSSRKKDKTKQGLPGPPKSLVSNLWMEPATTATEATGGGGVKGETHPNITL